MIEISFPSPSCSAFVLLGFLVVPFPLFFWPLKMPIEFAEKANSATPLHKELRFVTSQQIKNQYLAQAIELLFFFSS